MKIVLGLRYVGFRVYGIFLCIFAAKPVHGTISIIMNPQNNIGYYLGPYTTTTGHGNALSGLHLKLRHRAEAPKSLRHSAVCMTLLLHHE